MGKLTIYRLGNVEVISKSFSVKSVGKFHFCIASFEGVGGDPAPPHFSQQNFEKNPLLVFK